MHTPLHIVRQWHDALNQGEIEKLVSLVHPDVVVGGPRGSTSGAHVMREWFGRANVRHHRRARPSTGRSRSRRRRRVDRSGKRGSDRTAARCQCLCRGRWLDHAHRPPRSARRCPVRHRSHLVRQGIINSIDCDSAIGASVAYFFAYLRCLLQVKVQQHLSSLEDIAIIAKFHRISL